MLRALYPFNSSEQGTLSANQDDLFCGMCVDNSKLWMQVIDDKGAVGYLPTNYLQYCNWVDEKFTLQFIDDAVENIHTLASVVGKYTNTQHEQLRLLVAHRATIADNFAYYTKQIKECCPASAMDHPDTIPPPPESANQSTSTTELSNHHSASGDNSKQTHRKEESNLAAIERSCSPDHIAAQLTEILRFRTGLSHEKSKLGVSAILECLLAHNINVDDLAHICQSVEQDNLPSTEALELNHDIIEMDSVFESIAECKNDSQQRGWHLHDDEYYIQNKLGRLLEILTSGNRDTLVAHIRKDLDCIHNLVLYYQMETRSTLRAVMLQIFAALCTMSAIFITTILYTVLPLELVRDLMSTEDEQRMTYSAIVLSMLLSTGEQIPANYEEVLSESFVDFLLDQIENAVDRKISDICLELLLSFNQHFTASQENLVLRQLSKRQESTILTQNFLKLFNEGEDPVRVIPNDDQLSSVLKFAIDLYSTEETAQLIYTNDHKVLIDIIIRQLTDLSDTDKIRSDYLSLMQLILSNTEYNNHCHRKEDLLTALNQIEFNEEPSGDQSEMDARIAQEIRKLL